MSDKSNIPLIIEIPTTEQKKKNSRKLTPRECARLQGFPDTFKIPVSNTQAYRQFGNTVPVNVIKKLAEQIIKHLK